jgi:integrase
MRKHGLWQRIQSDVTMLKERDDVGHALTGEEETVLVAECAKSRSRLLMPFVITLLETGSRYGTVRRLQWKNIDFTNRCLTFGKDKTRYGSGRTIPLSPRAVEVLKFWAQRFPDRQPEHFVFPSERIGGSGANDTFGFTVGAVYESDPTRPVGDIKTAWGVARKHAGLSSVRIHDLRHSAVSRMIVARTPLPIISKSSDGHPAPWRRWLRDTDISRSMRCAPRSRVSVALPQNLMRRWS